jgi:hypothetical protein
MKKFLVVCVAIAGALYLAYLVILPTVYLRYRLTLDVDVDGVIRTGSGVVEIAYQPLPDWLVDISQSAHFGGEMSGYAITVDLGERGSLFVANARPFFVVDPKTHLMALPRAGNLSMLPFVAYGLPQDGLPSEMLRLARELRATKRPIDLPPDKLPMLVRFRNINDRDTFEEADPRDLTAAYGSGVRLARARFEFTTDPVSPMPGNWPKWLRAADDSEYRQTGSHLVAFPVIPWFKS